MRVEWLKSRLRGTRFHRILNRVQGRSAANRSTVITDQSDAYDRQTVEVMRRVLRPDASGIDVGAHVGAILQHLVAIAPTGTHHAFEALPHLAAELRVRFPGVRVHQVAVSDSNGEAEFQHVENDPAYSGLRRRVYDRPDPQVTTIRVKVVTLDDVVPIEQPIAFIKIDIEGGEYHAIKGAMQTIKRWHPVIVFEAGKNSTGQYGVTPLELYSLITQSFGYELSTMSRWTAQERPYTLEEFCDNWNTGPDYYFIATPTDVAHGATKTVD